MNPPCYTPSMSDLLTKSGSMCEVNFHSNITNTNFLWYLLISSNRVLIPLESNLFIKEDKKVKWYSDDRYPMSKSIYSLSQFGNRISIVNFVRWVFRQKCRFISINEKAIKKNKRIKYSFFLFYFISSWESLVKIESTQLKSCKTFYMDLFIGSIGSS
jgi:hypothetical protein